MFSHHSHFRFCDLNDAFDAAAAWQTVPGLVRLNCRLGVIVGSDSNWALGGDQSHSHVVRFEIDRRFFGINADRVKSAVRRWNFCIHQDFAGLFVHGSDI